MAKQRDATSGKRRPVFTRRSRIVLNEAQRSALIGRRRSPQRLSEADIEKAIGARLDKPSAVFRQGLVIDPCRETTAAERCLEAKGETPSSGASANGSGSPSVAVAGDGNQPGSNVAFNKRTWIARLMASQTSPEDHVVFGSADAGFEPTLTAGGISDVINGLVLSPGPADVPAFYDFTRSRWPSNRSGKKHWTTGISTM